jgi:aryl-alcohol dehydrogenase-like predicted oxidoreductase
LAADHGRSLTDLAFAWLLRRDVASVIAGATRPEEVEANVAAADWALPAEVDRIAPVWPVAGRRNPGAARHASRRSTGPSGSC